MALWRFGGGWSGETMQRYLAEAATRPVNFDTPLAEMTAANGWKIDGAHSVIGQEPPGAPSSDGFFQRAKQALINYDFSDPSIVVGHFDPKAEFVGRTMLLEIQVWGLHFLSGVRVHSVRDETLDEKSTFGFRYDTLEGHIERGFEWFLLTKDHASGAIDFNIEAHWRLGEFPNWWTKIGFRLIGEKHRESWRRAALERLTRLGHLPQVEATAPPGELAHRGDETAPRTSKSFSRQ
jgi:uncharacterized protein (UPF0548 family)